MMRPSSTAALLLGLFLAGCADRPAAPGPATSRMTEPRRHGRPAPSRGDQAERQARADRADPDVMRAQDLLLARTPGSAARAAAFYRLAAARGNAVAQYNLGMLHEDGLGVRASRADAIGWYGRAAANRDAEMRDLAAARLATLREPVTASP